MLANSTWGNSTYLNHISVKRLGGSEDICSPMSEQKTFFKSTRSIGSVGGKVSLRRGCERVQKHVVPDPLMKLSAS